MTRNQAKALEHCDGKAAELMGNIINLINDPGNQLSLFEVLQVKYALGILRLDKMMYGEAERTELLDAIDDWLTFDLECKRGNVVCVG